MTRLTQTGAEIQKRLDGEYPTLAAGDIPGGNKTELRADGTMRRVGTATAWKDMIADLFGKKLNATSGKVDYEWDENALKFQKGGSITTAIDRVGGNLEINHEFKVGTGITLRPHIHWFQEVSSGAVASFILTMRYRLQRNNLAKTTAWTTVTCEVGAGGDDIWDFTSETDGSYNQISRFPDIVIDCGVSDTLQFQMARTDGVTGDMLVYFMDMHGMVDSNGSDEEITKAP